MAREFGLGRLYAPDERDRHYTLGPDAMKLLQQAKAPASRKMPYKEGPRLFQIGPVCVGASCRGLLNAAPIMVKPNTGPSMYHFYAAAQRLDEWPGENYDGSSVRGGCKALQQQGYIQSYLWLDTRPSAVEASLLTMIDFMRLGYGTVIVGTNWYLSMDDVDGDGYILSPGTTETPVGGHAYRINWYDEKRNAFLVVNSWGYLWGEEDPDGTPGPYKGTAWMRAPLMRRLMVEEGEAACPTEVKVPAQV